MNETFAAGVNPEPLPESAVVEGAVEPVVPVTAPPPRFFTSEGDDDIIEREVVLHLDPYRLAPHGDRYIILKMKIGDKVMVETVNGPRKLYTSSIDEEEANGFYFAQIIAKGSGHRLESNTIVPMPFDPGDIVMVEKYSGRQYKLIGGKTYCTINQVDILTAVPELSPDRTLTNGNGRYAMTDAGQLVSV